MATPITDTGLRGFLKWVRREYPPVIYQKIAASVVQSFPQGFSGYMSGGWRSLGRLRGFGDAANPTVDVADAANSGAMSPSIGDQISEVIGTLTGSVLNYQQQQTQQNVINAQLALAAQGKTPANMTLSSNGITFGQAGNIGTAALWIVGGVLLLKVLKVI